VHGLQDQHLELQDRIEGRTAAFADGATLLSQPERRAKELEIDRCRELLQGIALPGEFLQAVLDIPKAWLMDHPYAPRNACLIESQDLPGVQFPESSFRS